MKHILAIAISFGIIGSPALAIKRFYGISRSVRAHGMGGAFYGLSDDEYALFYNPAGLGIYRGKGQFRLSTRVATTVDTISSTGTLSSTFSGSGKSTSEMINSLLSLQGKPLGGNVSIMPSFMTRKFALGILLPDLKVDFSVLGAGIDTSVDLSLIADAGILLSFASNFMDNQLSIGITPKFLTRVGGTKNIAAIDIVQGDKVDSDINSFGGYGAGVDFDLGASYKIPALPFGLVNRASFILSNVLATNYPMGSSRASSSSVGVPGLVRMVSLGWYTAFPGIGIIDNFHTVLDLAEFGFGGEADDTRGGRGGSFWKHVNVGLEAPILGWFVPRTGIHQGNITLGFGLRTRILELDYAWFGEELLGGVGRYTARSHELRVAVGFGAATPAPISLETLQSKPQGFEAPPESGNPDEVNSPDQPMDPVPKTKTGPAIQPTPKVEAVPSTAPNENRIPQSIRSSHPSNQKR